mmetsp:Transcript_23683/g.23441  ORF Transcript_23683/g.23441 Transcript_23683/m.23441 type:complete len:89 (+) Transcript_23683:73-339(+)
MLGPSSQKLMRSPEVHKYSWLRCGVSNSLWTKGKEQYLIQDCLAQVVRYDQDLDLCIQPQHCVPFDQTPAAALDQQSMSPATAATHGG